MTFRAGSGLRHVLLGLVFVASVAVAGDSVPVAPAIGDAAPDFELASLRFYDFRVDDREITRDNAWRLYEPVRSSDFRNKRPVVLVFGSYSAPIRAELPALEKLHREYADRVQFLFVYIREAEMGGTPRGPQTDLERIQIANHFANEVSLSVPLLVDDMLDTTMKNYAAHPARVYGIDRDGRIAFVGPPASLEVTGPELEAVLSSGTRSSP